jgi:hypothetical protein
MHVAPAERHVGDEVDGRPAEQRRGGDDLQLVLDVAERLLEAERDERFCPMKCVGSG